MPEVAEFARLEMLRDESANLEILKAEMGAENVYEVTLEQAAATWLEMAQLESVQEILETTGTEIVEVCNSLRPSQD